MFWKTNTSICILVPVDFVPRCDRIMLGDHVAGRRGRTRKTHAALARQVVELTLSKGLRPGDHLPEQAFATFFAVSHTPMRATFRILAENGFLTARPDAGHALAVDPEAGGPAIERQLDAADGSLGDRILADRAARRLDDVLAVGVLIRRHRATRSAVLNALAVLQQDGIVEHAPGQSRAFRPILDTPGSDADSLQFRVLLEPAVIITPGFDLDQTRARHLRLQMQHALAENGVWIGAQAFHRQGTEFHGMIAQGAANRFARDALVAHHRLRRITQTDHCTPEFRLRQALQEHLDILNSLGRRQFDVAADQMTLHLRLSRNRRPDAANRGSLPVLRLTGPAPR